MSPDNSEKFYFVKGSFRTNVDKNNMIRATFNQYVENLDGEIWKQLVDHPKYSVSNKGRFKRVFAQRGNPGYMFEQLMTPYTNNYGYYMVTIWENQKRLQFQLHVLVAKYFVLNPDPDTLVQVDHIDTILSHNYAENLRWCTHQENTVNPITVEHRVSSNKRNRNKKIHMFKNGELFDVFDRVIDIPKKYPELKLNALYGFIDRNVTYKNYTFKYV